MKIITFFRKFLHSEGIKKYDNKNQWKVCPGISQKTFTPPPSPSDLHENALSDNCAIQINRVK